jgi:fused signal recognition particle receptor
MGPEAEGTGVQVPDTSLLDEPLVWGGGAVGVLVTALLLRAALTRSARLQPDGASTAITDEARAPEPQREQVEDGVVARLRAALFRSREALQGRFDQLFGSRPVDESLFDELEVALLSADVGMPTTVRLLEPLRKLVAQGERDPDHLRAALRDGMKSVLSAAPASLAPVVSEGPWIILVVGVNGSGKTTTIGKLASQLTQRGRRVMLAAGDTFRAAASEQLQVWAERAGADIVSHREGADPGAVVFDALQAARARGHDVVIVDTAGRLQTRKPLMDQLTKIRRVIDKVIPGGPHETLLVLDGTMGQNALSQARLFHEATPLTGLVLTKLDGTAKGGMVLTLACELALPVQWIGIGEKLEDLRPFDADAFVRALA